MVVRKRPKYGRSVTSIKIVTRSGVSHGSLTRGCVIGLRTRYLSSHYGLNHDHPGAQAYYDAQVAQFARWGVDFIKADDMLAPYHQREIAAYAQAIARCGRPVDLSLSPG